MRPQRTRNVLSYCTTLRCYTCLVEWISQSSRCVRLLWLLTYYSSSIEGVRGVRVLNASVRVDKSEIAYESTRKGILHTYASMLRDTDLVAYAILSSVPVTMVKKPENHVVHNI